MVSVPLDLDSLTGRGAFWWELVTLPEHSKLPLACLTVKALGACGALQRNPIRRPVAAVFPGRFALLSSVSDKCGGLAIELVIKGTVPARVHDSAPRVSVKMVMGGHGWQKRVHRRMLVVLLWWRF